MTVTIYRKNVAVKYLQVKVSIPDRLSVTVKGLFCETGRATPEIVEIIMGWQLVASILSLLDLKTIFFFLERFAYAVFHSIN